MGTGARCRTERHLTIGLCQPTFLWTGGATPTQPTRQVRQIRQTVAARARCQQRIPGVPTVGQIHTGALAATPAAFPTAGSAEPPTLHRAPSARLIMSTPTLFRIGDSRCSLQAQLPWLLMTPVFFFILNWQYRSDQATAAEEKLRLV